MTNNQLTDKRIHELKIYPEFFSAVCTGAKRAELRINDRDYRVGDVLHMFEYSKTTGRTGEYINVTVTHVADVSEWLAGYALVSFELQERRKAENQSMAASELLTRAKQLMYQSGGAPIENSLNTIDAFLFDAERAELQERREAMKPLAGIDLESAVDRLAEKCNRLEGGWSCDKQSAYYNGFRAGAEAGLNAEKEGNKS